MHSVHVHLYQVPQNSHSHTLTHSLTHITLPPLPGPAPVLVGSDPAGEQRFRGLLQDVRLYAAPLTRGQLHELHAQPPRADLRGVSGYLRYRPDERNKSFVVEVRDDGQEEGEELFYLQLVAAQGGARLPWPRPTATLRVMKSDSANGLFGFTGPCIPEVGGGAGGWGGRRAAPKRVQDG